MTVRPEHLDEFYRQLALLEDRCGGRRLLAACSGRTPWPQRGVYFFFENGEFREGGSTPRVVRVGTHALRPSKSTLWGRLAQHRGNVGGSAPGGGNHRGSIFRLHVGEALLALGGFPDEIAKTWAVGGTADRETRKAEYPLELAVSKKIGSMPFLWLSVDDPPSAESDRGVLERNAIGLLSNMDRPALDDSSATWLGRSAGRQAIRESGLWNVNHVRDGYDPDFLEVLSSYVARS